MDEYILMFRDCLNFRGVSSRKEFWLAVLFTFIYLNCILITCTIAYTLWWVYIVCVALTILPVAALMVRRLNSVGVTKKYLFFLLLPIAGWIVLIVIFSKKEVNI